MENRIFINLRQRPELKVPAAEWFHGKWGVPTSAYLDCMDDYLSGKTEYGWYLCLDGDRIVGGLGVIWVVLVLFYWFSVVEWLYKNSVVEGMNKSLWPILGLFLNFIAVFAFLIARDRPSRKVKNRVF